MRKPTIAAALLLVTSALTVIAGPASASTVGTPGVAAVRPRSQLSCRDTRAVWCSFVQISTLSTWGRTRSRLAPAGTWSTGCCWPRPASTPGPTSRSRCRPASRSPAGGTWWPASTLQPEHESAAWRLHGTPGTIPDGASATRSRRPRLACGISTTASRRLKSHTGIRIPPAGGSSPRPAPRKPRRKS